MAGSATVLLSTSYFPPISYMAILAKHKDIIIEQMETYPKQTYRNRCEIMTSSGKLDLIVPVSKPSGNHTITKYVEISYREAWKQHHWKSIRTAYRSSPYFNYYADLIHPLFITKDKYLIELNFKVLTLLNKIIGINTTFSFTEDYIKDNEGIMDLRMKMKPGKMVVSDLKEYPQVFSHKSGFIKDLSVLDLIFNIGPESKGYLLNAGS
jgi:hypothetical protein